MRCIKKELENMQRRHRNWRMYSMHVIIVHVVQDSVSRFGRGPRPCCAGLGFATWPEASAYL